MEINLKQLITESSIFDGRAENPSEVKKFVIALEEIYARIYLSLTNENYSNIIWFIIRQFVSETVNQVSYNCISPSFFILIGFYYAMIKWMNTWVVCICESFYTPAWGGEKGK